MRPYIRHIALIAAVLALLPVALKAQQTEPTPQYEMADSLVYRAVDTYDTSLAGMSAAEYLKSGSGRVELHQSQAVATGLGRHIASNRERSISGYRVRIYFDNKQNSRSASEAALKLFRSRYPGYGAYRTFVNPFFKVTAGDFRTRSEAMELLERVRRDFPGAFVVREAIEYPVIDRDNAYVVDTVRVSRPVAGGGL